VDPISHIWPIAGSNITVIPSRCRQTEGVDLANNIARGKTVDPFKDLPLDMLLQVADFLEIRDVESLSQASQSVAKLLDWSPYWRRWARRDMPWLWEVQALDNTSGSIFWRQAYADLQRKFSTTYIHADLGLVNRKKIWTQCRAIADSYASHAIELERETGHE
jgi:hypothetical protein